MGAPGTLIPADALSGKEPPLKSYNPQPNRLPSLRTTTGTQVSTQAGQSSVGGYNLSLGATSRKTEPLLPSLGSNANDGVGTSGLNERAHPANQLDHSLSQAIGSSLNMGSLGPRLAGDSVRINVNVVPYSPKGAEDPKNLFAELNPFQIKGSSKTVVQNDITNEVGKLQFPKTNIVNTRPPSPLMWKNRHAWNEVPRENGNGFVEGSFMKNYQGSNKGNAASVVSRSSNVAPKASELPGPYAIVGDKRDSVSSNKSMFASAEGRPSHMSSMEDFSFNDSETYNEENGNVVKIENSKREDHMNNIIGLHEDKKNVRDRLIRTSKELVETEGTSSLDAGANVVDTEIDDVGDCEIVWEDLVLGERIGLGNTTTC